MTTKPQFTEVQQANWLQYESVRSSGLFNMFDPKAQEKAGLTNEEFFFVMGNYDALKKEVTGNE